MGGRGGGSSLASKSAAPSAAPAALPSAKELFQQWLKNPRNITADVVGEGGDGRDKYSILLPDHDATIAWDGSSYIIRDVHTDERIGTFKGQTERPLLRQISKFYGRKVERTNRNGQMGTYGSDAPDVTKTPAARKYGVS